MESLMESNQLIATLDALASEWGSKTDDELVALLSQSVGRLKDELINQATAIRLLESRGWDVERLRAAGGAMVDWYRRIAYGTVLPDVLHRYGHRDTLLRKIAALPPPDQKRLCEGGTVTVLVVTENGASERTVDPLDLSTEESSQVFGRGQIRTLAEQRSWLDGKESKRQSRRKMITQGVFVDRKRKLAVVEVPTEFTHHDLLRLAEELT